MQRILFLTNSLTGGGAERAMNLVANKLFELGFEVGLVPINESGEDYVKLECQVFPLHRQWKSGLISTFKSGRRFTKVARDFKPDIIIATCELPELFMAFYRFKCRVFIVEEAKEPWRNRRLVGNLIRRVLQTKKVTWVGSSGHLEIWPFGQMPPWTIPNALTNFPRTNIISEVDTPRLENADGRLAYVGRFSPEKQPDWFISICEKVKRRAICFGSGIMEEDLKYRSAMEFCDIEFRGFVSNPWSELHANDLLVVPSASEGDGLVVVEAISHHIPLLLSDIPEFRYFGLPDKHYCINVDEFVARIEEFSADFAQLKAQEELRMKIMDSRSIETIGKQWVDLFASKGIK